MNTTTTQSPIPNWLNGNDRPDIWEAVTEARKRCFLPPTGWVERGDCVALQYIDIGSEPESSQTIYERIEQRVRYEKANVIPAAEKLCKELGVTLLTPGDEEHCIRGGFRIRDEVEPGFARIKTFRGEYDLEVSVWDTPIECKVIRYAVRTDNGPAVSYGGIQFESSNGHKNKFGWVSGGFSSLKWPYKILKGQVPESPNPKLPFRDVSFQNAPQPGSGYSSAKSAITTVTVAFRKTTVYRNLAGVVKYHICNETTGARVSRPLPSKEIAEEALVKWQNAGHKASLCVSSGFPWEIAPEAWQEFSGVKTLEELRTAVLNFPEDWEGVERAFCSHHPLGDKFGVVTGIDYGNSPVEGGMVIKNPKAESAGSSSLFIWERSTGLGLVSVTKNGLEWKIPRRRVVMSE